MRKEKLRQARTERVERLARGYLGRRCGARVAVGWRAEVLRCQVTGQGDDHLPLDNGLVAFAFLLQLASAVLDVM